MEKIVIIMVAYNKPEFIELQYRTLKKFLVNDFDYIVFNNALPGEMKIRINETCKSLGVPLVQVKSNQGTDSMRAGKSLDFSIRYVAKHFRGKVMVIDSDMFLIDRYDVVKALGNFDFMGIVQKVDEFIYYKNQFLHLNLSTLPKTHHITFQPGKITKDDERMFDCGIYLHNYFLYNPGVRHSPVIEISGNRFTFDENRELVDTHSGKSDALEMINSNTSLKEFFLNECQIFGKNVDKNPAFVANHSFSELIQNVFLHLRGGSNWMGIDSKIIRSREDNFFAYLKSLV